MTGFATTTGRSMKLSWGNVEIENELQEFLIRNRVVLVLVILVKHFLHQVFIDFIIGHIMPIGLCDDHLFCSMPWHIVQHSVKTVCNTVDEGFGGQSTGPLHVSCALADDKPPVHDLAQCLAVLVHCVLIARVKRGCMLKGSNHSFHHAKWVEARLLTPKVCMP